MAKKKTPPKKTTNKAPLGYDNAKATSDTNADIAAGEGYGRKLADEFYNPSDLGKTQIDATRSDETKNILNNYATAYANAGNRTQATTDYLSRLQNTMQTAGQRTAEQNYYLNSQKNIADNGYTSPQFQALYENMRGTTDANNAQSNYNLALSQANSGVRGAALGAQNQQMQQQQMLNDNALKQALAVKGMDYQTNALNQYGTGLNAIDKQNFDQGQTATNAYGNALSGTEKNEYDRTQTARNDWSAQVQGAQANESAAQKYNNDAYNNFQAGRMGAVTGGTGAYLATLNGNRANQLNNRATNFATSHYQN